MNSFRDRGRLIKNHKRSSKTFLIISPKMQGIKDYSEMKIGQEVFC